MRALRAVAIAAIGAIAVAALPATPAVAVGIGAESPNPPTWARAAVRATPKISRATGFLSITAKEGGQSAEVDNDFEFDRPAGYFSSTLSTAAGDDLLTAYVHGDQTWLTIDSPAFRQRLPQGVQYVTVATADLTAGGVISTDPAVNFAPVYLLLGVRHVQAKPLEGAGHHVYDFDVDLAAARHALPAFERAAFLKTLGQFTSATVRHVSGSTTIDDQHHVLDLSVRLDLAKGVNRGGRFVLDLNLDRIDTTVDAVTPPDAQSVPIDSVPGLRQQLGKLTPSATAGTT